MKKTLENRQSFTRKLMQLLVLMAMLLAPKGAWAVEYTTATGGPESVSGADWKFTWTVSGLGAFKIYSNSQTESTVTLSETPVGLQVTSGGCTIRGIKGTQPTMTLYSECIYKVVISADRNVDNSKITVKIKKWGGSEYKTLSPSTTPGEFYFPEPEDWDDESEEDDELIIEVNDECVITSIKVYSSKIEGTPYYWPTAPTTNNNTAIENAKQEDGSLIINLNELNTFTYPLTDIYTDKPVVGATYTSSDETIATVASDGVVSIKKKGSTVIYASASNPAETSDNLIYAYKLTVTQDEVSYGLTVAGAPVTSENAEEITGNGIQVQYRSMLRRTR